MVERHSVYNKTTIIERLASNVFPERPEFKGIYLNVFALSRLYCPRRFISFFVRGYFYKRAISRGIKGSDQYRLTSRFFRRKMSTHSFNNSLMTNNSMFIHYNTLADGW